MTDTESKNYNKSKLEGTEFPLKYGYFGVKCRSAEEISNGVTLSQGLVREQSYFEDDSVYGALDQNRFGVKNLTQKLAFLFELRLKGEMPAIKAEIGKQI